MSRNKIGNVEFVEVCKVVLFLFLSFNQFVATHNRSLLFDCPASNMKKLAIFFLKES